MKRESLLLVAIATVSLIAGYGLYQLTLDSPAENTSGGPAALAAIPFTDLEGRQKLLGDWKQPLLIVNFWAPWCTPCRREIPALIEIQQEYAGNIQVVGLALDSVENIQSFASEYNINYPSFIAGANIPMYNAAFDNKSGSLPHTAIVNRERILSYSHTGEITADQLREKIDQLLSFH